MGNKASSPSTAAAAIVVNTAGISDGKHETKTKKKKSKRRAWLFLKGKPKPTQDTEERRRSVEACSPTTVRADSPNSLDGLDHQLGAFVVDETENAKGSPLTPPTSVTAPTPTPTSPPASKETIRATSMVAANAKNGANSNKKPIPKAAAAVNKKRRTAPATRRPTGARSPTDSPSPKKTKAMQQNQQSPAKTENENGTGTTANPPRTRTGGNRAANAKKRPNTTVTTSDVRQAQARNNHRARAKARSPTASPSPKKTKAVQQQSPADGGTITPANSPRNGTGKGANTGTGTETAANARRRRKPTSTTSAKVQANNNRARSTSARSPTASPPPKKTKAIMGNGAQRKVSAESPTRRHQTASPSSPTKAVVHQESTSTSLEKTVLSETASATPRTVSPSPPSPTSPQVTTTSTKVATAVNVTTSYTEETIKTPNNPQKNKRQQTVAFVNEAQAQGKTGLLASRSPTASPLPKTARRTSTPSPKTNADEEVAGSTNTAATAAPSPLNPDDVPSLPAPNTNISPLASQEEVLKAYEKEMQQQLNPNASDSDLSLEGEEDEEPSALPLSTPASNKRRSSLFQRVMPSRPATTVAEEEEEPSPLVPGRRRSSLLGRMMSKRPETSTEESGPISSTTPMGRRRSSLLQRLAVPQRQSMFLNKRGSMFARRSSSIRNKRTSSFAVSLAERNSSNYTPLDVNQAYREAPKSKWKQQKVKFSGKYDCVRLGKVEHIKGKKIDKGVRTFKANPDKYVAMVYQTSSMYARSKQHFAYTYIHREGTSLLAPMDVDNKGLMTMMTQDYQHLPPMPDNQLPAEFRDAFTWDMTLDGKKIHSPSNPPLLPGRGMGAGDTPNLKIIGDIDPQDVCQGDVGNCWLLSAISALAEFDGAIKRLFRKTVDLDFMPGDEPNQYTITLFDLATWKEVDIVIDESLPAHPTLKGELLGSKISDDGELWVCYLEKAFAIHCGGSLDSLEGGHCTHAWSMLTGKKEQYFIRKDYRTGKYYCSAKYDMYTEKWKELSNTPSAKDVAGLEPVPWPEVGGGGSAYDEISADELFLKMYAWDLENYIVGASSKHTDEDGVSSGMVRNHAYSVLDAFHHVAGTDFDLFKIRNPWGHGEIEDGLFSDDGPGWKQYPQIKRELKPVVADDGIFYLTKEEFFENFDHIFLSASNMTEFKED